MTDRLYYNVDLNNDLDNEHYIITK